MEIEITIKIPLVAGGPSGQKQSVGVETSQESTYQETPSPAEFGIPTAPSISEIGPPSLEMIEHVAGIPAMTDRPPRLEDFRLDESLPGQHLSPPDLPDLSQVPSVTEEFAPPSIEDVKIPATRRRSTRKVTSGSNENRGKGRGRTQPQ